MPKKVVLPDLGSPQALLSVWFVQSGDRVYAGDRLVEVLIDAATFDVPSPVTGRLVEKCAWPDDSLVPGQVLGVVEEEENPLPVIQARKRTR